MSDALPSDDIWTIRRVLQWTTAFFRDKQIESARLDAELLIGDALKLDRIRVYMEHDRPLYPEELKAIRERVQRRGRREPVAYILGERGFWELVLKVDARVLIPRPETELLVERSLALLAGREAPLVVDVGTGSGAIALSIAQARPDARVVATDRSVGALDLARENATANALLNVELQIGDLLDPVKHEVGRIDLVVSNPPYIASAECETLMADVSRFEPRMALDGGPDGLALIRRLVRQAGTLLKPGGWLLFEMGSTQGEAAKAIVQADGRFAEVTVRQDLAGLDRVVEAQRP